MYVPKIYEEKDPREIRNFIRENSFGILVSQVDNRPWATHIPFELEKDNDGNDILVAHIAKNNPQSKNLVDGLEVLCIFNGPHSYISSSWYDEEEVPTWNYLAVHVYGEIRIQTDEELLASLHNLVNHYEKNEQKPIQLNKLSEKTMRQMNGIIGFIIQIKEFQAVRKLSQTRNDWSHRNIVHKLEGKDDPNSHAIAKEMKTDRRS